MMKRATPKMFWTLLVLSVGLGLGPTRTARAHCDGMDGPVVKAAEQALEKGSVDPVLIWVPKHDEPEIRSAFARTISVRKLGGEARGLADQYFFETLVRVHRAGEGAPYTGLKPAGRDLGPAIPAADRALVTGNVEAVGKLLVQTLHKGLLERFERARTLRRFSPEDVEAGRRFVAAYVPYIHYVEGLYRGASAEAGESHGAPHRCGEDGPGAGAAKSGHSGHQH